MTSTLKRTALFDKYAEHGGKTIDFGGWDLPVQFSSIKAEHEAVRTKAGLFDVSHMGEVLVSGKASLPYLQKIMTNDVSKLKVGQAQYTAMCYENGGTVDDLLIYKRSEDNYLLVVNASNIEKDLEWMNKHVIEDVKIEDASADYALLAIQGPVAEKVLQRLTTEPLNEIGFFRFKENVLICGQNVLVSRTGYTGEDGFELYATPEAIVVLWSAILLAGESDGVIPAGLGARDTLRFESGLPLYGQELSKDISPLEAGLAFVVKLNKDEDFIGKEVLAAQKENGVSRKLVGLEMIDNGIPRTGYTVLMGEEVIGEVTTGTQSPTLQKNIGFALINAEHAEKGTEVIVQVRKRFLKAVVVATPFYKREK
ncbi:glycine cleavage system aminomethyltransferase GcvT [Sporosarcina sp. FA9]|uniref:glycine cleavage system aminomethyltransferase GcvT n=1 Tax=Sporosarcina sp. FA9 TaxID=3413030 RepID=UPI003F6555A2